MVSAIPEAEFGKRSHSRNPLIFGLFARMHLVEQVGSGVGRIKDLMKESGLPEPVFEKVGIFAVILSRPAKSSVEGSGEDAQKTTQKTTQKSNLKSNLKTDLKILTLMKEQPEISLPEIAEGLQLSLGAIKKQVHKLKKQGKIIRMGPDKGGHWIIVNRNS